MPVTCELPAPVRCLNSEMGNRGRDPMFCLPPQAVLKPQPAEQARKLLKLALWVGSGRWGNQGRSELRTELHLLWAPILRAFAQGTPEGQGRLQVWSQ